MRIQAARLAELLRQSGFRLAWSDRAEECGFVRVGDVGDLYEQLIVKGVGKQGEAVFANAAVSVVSGPTATKGMVEMRLVDELATDQNRGWAVLDSHKQAIDWERRLAAVGPSRAREVAREKGAELLHRTHAARDVAKSVMGLLPSANEFDTLRSWLLERATESARAEAERLADWPGVMRLVGGEEVYRVATLALVVLHPTGPGDAGSDPLQHPELMWQIQLLADRLMSRCGFTAETLRASKPNA